LAVGPGLVVRLVERSVVERVALGCGAGCRSAARRGIADRVVAGLRAVDRPVALVLGLVITHTARIVKGRRRDRVTPREPAESRGFRWSAARQPSRRAGAKSALPRPNRAVRGGCSEPGVAGA